MDTQRNIYSLSDLAKSLRSVIERNYSSSYWIKAEIAKLNHYPRSGHCYPDLVDKSGDQIMAQMRAIIWATDYRKTNEEFLKVTGQPLGEGMAILFQASVSFHPVHGLSLLIHNIEPSFTLGQMAHEKQQNLERLQREGILGNNRLLHMPLLPRRLAVISVETSKGYHDFLQILKGYSQQYSIFHHLFPALLQGDKAVEGIISQLRRIRKAAGMFDMVAIIRGGGGDVGLNAYNAYNLGREIALFPIPVITGIGHATNQTIAEMVAWANKITPTDVGYFVIGRFTEFDNRLQKAKDQIFQKAANIINQQQQNLTRKASLLQSFSVKAVDKENRHLQYTSGRLDMATHRFLENKKQLLQHAQGKIKLLDPLQVLKRGYSITICQGKSLRDSENITPGDIITTRLFRGSLESVVKSKTNQP